MDQSVGSMRRAITYLLRHIINADVDGCEALTGGFEGVFSEVRFVTAGLWEASLS